jgi:hypothetical protein
MKHKKGMFAVFLLVLPLLAPMNVLANLIPTPIITMMDEYINAIIYQMGGDYWAYVHCRYQFRNIGYSAVTMKFPIPPGSQDISVSVENIPIYWSWSEEKYPTEIGEYRMITWTVNNPPEKFEVKVIYRHKLVGAAGEYIFLYAFGTGKYADIYVKQVTAYVRLAVVGAAQSYTARLGSETIDSGRANEMLLTRGYDFQSGMFRSFTKDFIFTFNASAAPSDLLLSTDKHVYAEGEPVEFWLHNADGESVMLRNSAPWIILSMKHGMSIVYTPVALQAVREVAPGETVSWTWNQRNNGGEQVEPGLYAVILEAGGQRLISPFTIRRTVEFPGSLNVTLRLYPKKATVRLDALLKERPEQAEVFRNLTVKAVVLPRGERLTGAFYVEGMIALDRLEEFPLNYLSLHIRYERPSGEGNFSVDFKPEENLPLKRASAEFTTSQRDSSLIDLNLNASIVFSKEHLKEETARMLEMYVAALSTQAGMEMARQKVEKATGGSVKLENLALSFSRETYTLNCTVTVKIDSSALSMLQSAVPGVPEMVGSLQPNMTWIATANLTLLGLNVEYHGESRIFNGNLMLVAEENVSTMIKKASEALIDTLVRRSAAASILSGWLRNFKIGIHGRLDFTLTIPANELHVSGISLQYKEDPSQTPVRIMEAISGITALPRNVAIILGAGSTEYEEVILKLPSGESKDRILISGNTSALSDVTYEVDGNPWRVVDYKVHEEELAIGGHKYRAFIATNSTQKEFRAADGRITISVEGPSRLMGGLNLLMPKIALGGADPESIEVLVDGEPAGWILTERDGNYSILVTYPQHKNTIEVKWTLPSAFPTTIVALVVGAAAAAVIIAIVIKKR